MCCVSKAAGVVADADDQHLSATTAIRLVQQTLQQQQNKSNNKQQSVFISNDTNAIKLYYSYLRRQQYARRCVCLYVYVYMGCCGYVSLLYCGAGKCEN